MLRGGMGSSEGPIGLRLKKPVAPFGETLPRDSVLSALWLLSWVSSTSSSYPHCEAFADYP